MKQPTKLIKVCGMREPDNIRALAQLPLSFMGTIFYPKSPRFSGNREDSAEAFRVLPSSIKKVGVFVKPTLEELAKYQKSFALNYLQIHSDEELSFCKEARAIAPLIKAFGIDKETNFAEIENYCSVADYFIFDTATKSYGGSGKKFDWKMIQSYSGDTPFLLAGGLGPKDVETLQMTDHPQCIGFDINSGFEITPAVKDIEAIASFLSALR